MKGFALPASVAAALALVASSGASASDAEHRLRSRPYTHHIYASVSPSGVEEVRKIWESGAIVVEPHDPALVTHRVAALPDVLARLRAAGLLVRVENDDFQTLIDASYDKWSNPPPRAHGDASTLPPF